jgi:tRNA (guanosine-2'-O-)-methyltransferase
MRRSSANTSFIAVQQRNLVAAIDGLDAAAVARTLEAFVTDDRRARFEEVFARRLDAVTVLFDAPHDPHNAAAVVRSCDAFGVARLHVVERLEAFLAANSVARGSERWVELVTHATSASAVARLRASNHTMIATHPEGELEPEDLHEIPRLAIVLGNEKFGIDPEIRAACAGAVRIPMRGFAESLNVSVTAAVLLERATRGRPGDLDAAERTRLYARALVLSVPHAPEILAERRPDLLKT